MAPLSASHRGEDVSHFLGADFRSASLRVHPGMTSGFSVIRSNPRLTTPIGDYIMRTARKRALPCATRS
jgi:hypothetical protein